MDETLLIKGINCCVDKNHGTKEGGGKMQKKLIIYLLVTALFGLVGLIAHSEAVAECEIAYSCQFVDSKDAITPYTLKFINTSDPYLWKYQLQGPSAVNQITALVPVCCPKLGYSPIGGGQIEDPGTGDPTTGFGVGDYAHQVIRLALNPPDSYSFSTSEHVTRLENASFQLKSGKAIYYCKNMAVPACSIGNPYQPEIRLEEFYIKTKKIKVEWDESGQTCSAVSVAYWNGDAWVSVLPDKGPDVNGEPIKDCGPLEGNQKCKRCVVSGGTNSWAWLYIGGNWYLINLG